MSLRTRALRGVFWSSLKGWSGNFIGAIVFVFLARLLEPRDFGLLAMAAVFTTLGGVLADAGIGSAIIQRERLKAEHLDTAFWLSLGIGVALWLLSIAAAPGIAWLYSAPDLTNVVRWLSLGFVFSGASGVATAVLRRDLGFRALALRSIAGSVIGGMTAIAMALSGFGVWSLVGQRLAEGCTGTILVWIACPWRPGRRGKLSHVNELLSFGMNILGSRLLVFFSRRSDQFLIGYLFGNVALGYYFVGYRLIRVVVELFAKSVSAVLMPTLSRIQFDRKRMRGAYYQIIRLAGLITMPTFISIALMAPELTEVLFGPKWMHSAAVMRILAFGGLLQGIVFVNAPTLAAAGKPSWSMWLNAVDAVSTVAAIMIAVQWESIAIVALAYTLRAYLLFPLRMLAIRKILDVKWREYTRQLLPTLIACSVMAAVVTAFRVFTKDVLSTAAQLALGVIVAGLTYGAAIIVTDLPGLRGLMTAMKMALPFGPGSKNLEQSGDVSVVVDEVTDVTRAG